MEWDASCDYDAVTILDGDDENAPLLGVFCGSGPIDQPIVASGNVMGVIFLSDSSVTDSGFTATFESYSQGRLL